MDSLQSMFTNPGNSFNYDICPPSTLVAPLPPLEAVTCLSSPVTIPLAPSLSPATLSPAPTYTDQNIKDSNTTDNATDSDTTAADTKDYIDSISQTQEILSIASTTVTTTVTASAMATLVTMKRARADSTVIDPKKTVPL